MVEKRLDTTFHALADPTRRGMLASLALGEKSIGELASPFEMSFAGAPIQRVAPDTIRRERVLDAPPETVWRYLTQADLRRQWFMGGTDAHAGGEFDLVIDHDNLSDEANVPYPEGYAKFKGSVWAEK